MKVVVFEMAQNIYQKIWATFAKKICYKIVQKSPNLFTHFYLIN